MTEQWQELKETITEMRDSNGTCTQKEVCKFLVNYMEILEKQMQEPKTGHWKIIPFSDNYGEYRPPKYACSECGWEIDLCRGLQQDTGHRLFCEHCGANMVEPQESEVEK